MKLKAALFALLFAGYLLLSHWVLAAPQQHMVLGVLLALTPPVAGLSLFLLASGRRWLVPLLFAALAFSLWRAPGWFADHFAWLYFLQDAGTQLFLGLMFGRTLLAGQQPLCSQIAALIHGGLDEAQARYSRQVTVAWTLFFFGMFVLSGALFLCAPLTIWSAFSNLMVFPLVGVMFVAEYALRLVCLPQWRGRMRFTDTFRAYRALGGQAQGGRAGSR